MIRMRNTLPARILSGLLLSCCFIFWSCEESEGPAEIRPESTVLQTLNQQEDLSSFAAALQRTGLDSDVQNPNANFTLFAPTNAAFTSFLQENGYSSLDNVPAAELNNLISYHVAFGRWMASRLDSAVLVDTFRDRKLFVYKTKGSNKITLNNEAEIVKSDLFARNGVVHGLDKVLTPPNQTLAQWVEAKANAEDSSFTFLHAALQRADLVNFLNNRKQQFTFFAPTDSAFVAAGFATLEDVDNADPAELKKILLYHLLPYYQYSFMLRSILTTQQGQKLVYSADNKTLKGAGNAADKVANLVTPDIDLLMINGIIHVVDRLLMPAE